MSHKQKLLRAHKQICTQKFPFSVCLAYKATLGMEKKRMETMHNNPSTPVLIIQSYLLLLLDHFHKCRENISKK